jgi:hypothetical protein
MTNFNVVSQIDSQAEGRIRDISGERLASHVIQSIEGLNTRISTTLSLDVRLIGFFRSINLRSQDALQDTLRLLTMWFKYGAHEEISHTIASGFSMVKIDTWLPVIPQVRGIHSRHSSELTRGPDHRTYPNASRKYPPEHQQPAHRSRQKPSTGVDLPAYRRFQISQRISEECRPRHYGSNAGAQLNDRRAGLSPVFFI